MQPKIHISEDSKKPSAAPQGAESWEVHHLQPNDDINLGSL
jgi:hypothetical protein